MTAQNTNTAILAVKISRELLKQHGYRDFGEDLRLRADHMTLEPIEAPGTWHAPKPVKEALWQSEV
jgi:hypothetical protein